MFGRLSKKNLFINVVLILFCIYIVRLFIHGQINLYIHPRYTIFTVVMAVIGTLILVFSDIRAEKGHRHSNGRFRLKFVDTVVAVVVILAIILPAQPLSSNAIGRKSLNTPSYDNADAAKPCPTQKPNSIEMWVYEISEYPLHCYKGQSITLTGFVFESSENPLPGDMYYLGRVVMSCCVIDARPYALPIKQGEFPKYPKETWLTVEGTLEAAKINGAYQLVVEPKAVKQIDNPDQPYNYIETNPQL